MKVVVSRGIVSISDERMRKPTTFRFFTVPVRSRRADELNGVLQALLVSRTAKVTSESPIVGEEPITRVMWNPDGLTHVPVFNRAVLQECLDALGEGLLAG